MSLAPSSLNSPDPKRGAQRIIYARMVADLFHAGHVAFLANARALGDRLEVHIFADADVTKMKRAPIMTQAERMAVVAACRYVDHVYDAGTGPVTMDFMRRNNYSIYALGYATPEEAAYKRSRCSELPDHMIAEIPYTHGISTTEIRKRIQAAASDTTQVRWP